MDLAYFVAAILALATPGDLSRTGNTVLLDFGADWCHYCVQMDPIVAQLAADGYPIRKINVDREPALAERFGARQLPCFVMLVDGKEVDRVVGGANRARLEAMFRNHGVGPTVNSARGQSPDARTPAAGSVPFPATDRNGPLSGRTAPHPSPLPRGEGAILDDRRGSLDSGGSRFEQLLRTSVRLKIEDDKGNSCGSGTIIDARGGEALIITCGHIFRDAAKNGRVLVDLFGPGAPQGLPGRLIDFDLKSEVGLISIETNYPLTVARLAPPGFTLRPGDRVISIGCDGGAEPSVRDTRVTTINRYVGSANVQVAFQPVQGRSGGGLLTPDGLVVGVCYAADPEGNEGLFAALPALYAELDRAGLVFVFRDRAGSFEQTDGGKQRAVAADVFADRQLPPAAKSATTLTDQKVQPLSPEDHATLDMLREKAQGAEVICIVRPDGNPAAKSEIIVLDRVSPAFLQHLTAQRPAESQR